MDRLMHWRYISEDNVSDSYGLAADEVMALRVGENHSSSVLRLYTYRYLLDYFSS